jgi:hypothetical protein
MTSEATVTATIAPPLTAVVDLEAIRANLELVRRAVAPGTEIIGCVTPSRSWSRSAAMSATSTSAVVRSASRGLG